MQSTQAFSRIGFSLTEDGEAIGTVRQFSDRLNLPESRVLSCLQEKADQSVILRAGTESDQLLILDAGGVGALLGCAAADSTAE